MSSTRRIALTVNDQPYEAEVEPRLTLVDLLRGELGLTGTHVGCEHGVCGACTVLWNGRAVRSCIMLAVQADGGTIRTVEGLAREGTLHPIQQAFLDGFATQCGFCTSGMIMVAAGLIAANPSPARDDVVRAISGNVCRCTGYEAIIDAVLDAAARMRSDSHAQAA